jgi:hypothetical protein
MMDMMRVAELDEALRLGCLQALSGRNRLFSKMFLMGTALFQPPNFLDHGLAEANSGEKILQWKIFIGRMRMTIR